MIDSTLLLDDLKVIVRKLEADILARCRDTPAIDAFVRAEYNAARSAERTSQSYEAWREEAVTQAAVAWILACVFVRFIEDNLLLDEAAEERVWFAGPGHRLQRARDRHTIYFREHPTETDREYLKHVFRRAGNPDLRRPIPVVEGLFDEKHNPLWRLDVSGDGAELLLNFWQQVDPATGELRHDFTDAAWDTRFLGDLYQDMSEAVRKKYALLQTPVFVEEFILDRTLAPAVDEFGYQAVRVIDPTCGSGHFLLGAFERLFALHAKNDPAINPRELVQRALRSVHGVDLNPYAVAIARFRLLVAALRAAGIERLQDAPAFEFRLAVGDSLLHGTRPEAEQIGMGWESLAHVYETEDKDALDAILRSGHYHAVIGNPPYITVKDAKLNQAYRRRFGSCHMKYSLAVPFMERFFDLAIRSANGAGTSSGAGYVGMITSNSFMKREFGRKLIEQYIPRWDLTHVIDTSGAYIPGHGTPTVILFGRNRIPVAETIRTVMGIKGEPSTPAHPAHGKVWRSVVENVDLVGAQTEFVSVADSARVNFHRHPWSIGGGGAAELKEQLDESSVQILGKIADSIGITAFTLEDDIFLLPAKSAIRHKIPNEHQREMVQGDSVRDWLIGSNEIATFPYDQEFKPIPDQATTNCLRYLWHARTMLANNKMFGGKTKVECGLNWYEFGRLTVDKLQSQISITFAFVATHNHFVLDRGGKVFNRTAPAIKLPTDATENEHLELLGLLNSSTACFWGRETLFSRRGDPVGKWGEFLEWDGTKLLTFPLPKDRPLSLAQRLDQLSQTLQSILPASLVQKSAPTASEWESARAESHLIRQRMIALQEELDWQCYRLYDLIDEELTLPEDAIPPINLGERAFEIVLARRIAAGELTTTWFERHGSTPITEIPTHWPADYRQLVTQRIDAIENNPNIRLIEQPEYKRRWNTEAWESQAERALREWLLDRLEAPPLWSSEELISTARLADRIRHDRDFMQVAEMYRGRSDFDLARLVDELVRGEAVPFLPVLRYKPSGILKREVWERTWELQRAEDAIDARTLLAADDPDHMTPEQARRLKQEQIGDIPVPPKYKSTDFRDQTYWRLRGKLDVPKERFTSYPRCERDADPTMIIGWAGWDHLQQARVLANFYTLVKEQEAWGPARIAPLLAGLVELLPWLKQWHNEVDAEYGIGMGDFFANFVEEEARSLGLTVNKLKAWEPVD